MNPCILGVAPNGARRTRADHPTVPITPAELASTAEACLAAGASLFHLHVRDAKGVHLLDAGAYAEATAAIRERAGNGLIVQVTTESGGRYQPTEQIRVIEALRPEAVSVAPRELIPAEAEQVQAARFFHWLAETGIAVQYILYSPRELARFKALRRARVIPSGPAFLLFVLGSKASASNAHPDEIEPFVEIVDGEDLWAVCAFGPAESACVARAAQLGGHARVGFENNLRLPDGQAAAGNEELVHVAKNAVNEVERSVANALEARRLLQVDLGR